MSVLLLAFPFAIFGEVLQWSPIAIFILAAVAIIPFAGFIGAATEVLAFYTNPRIGGLLNATLGNAAELIITIVAIRAGYLELVKASITGSILGNLLLVLGMSILLGGLRHGVQKFDRKQASNNAIMLVLTVVILLIPSLLSHYIGNIELPEPRVETLSLGVATVMIVLYILGLIYSYKVIGGPVVVDEAVTESAHKGWSLRMGIAVLAVSTVGVAFLSEVFVGAVEPVVSTLGISEFFIGLIFIPIIGNVAEHLVAVQVALKNKMTLSVEIAIASSLQIALFVAPLLVFISLIIGHPLTLVFNQLELIALIAGVLIAALVSADGESNWLEGAELLAIYIILGLTFFLMPT
ncbi:MAG: calcium/proton exchanger [Chloroflexi bacterium RBG_19FT_COMBO_49_13]|nr:MAG: calcium/proton exchanger [Chloroflexi bacterium RBG_16_47_49]OGO62322.1 MAG: calcium/proton exchanger [Chloroflexi bacterium RBG_19FT_COMBO_49_13]